MTVGDDLPDDLLIDIALRLPLKSIIRLKCVCKSWRSLLERPTFVTEHLNSNKRSNFLLLKYYKDDIKKFACSLLAYETLDVVADIDFSDYKVDYELGRLDIMASCDGIICVQIRSSLNEICLWNPSICQFRKLMQGPRSDLADRYTFGFGFDAQRNDYKVIQIPDVRCYNQGSSNAASSADRAHIYELSSNSWRICDDIMPLAHYSSNSTHKVYTNGIYSWLVYDIYYHYQFIVSFDMSKEVFITSELPDHLRMLNATRGRSLMALNKCVVLFIVSNPYNHGVSGFQAEILMLNDYGVKESWTKLYIMRSSSYKLYRPWSFWKNGDLLATCKGKVILLNPETQKTKDTHLDSLRMTNPCLWFYKESLVPII